MSGYIVCDMDGTECVRVTIPDLFRNDFRTLTRPVWYCEMSRCFHYSVDQVCVENSTGIPHPLLPLPRTPFLCIPRCC